MFRGPAETEQLKQYAVEPDVTNADNILNVLCLCRTCHHLYDHAAVTLVPNIDFAVVTFLYSPWSQGLYDVAVEFPGGCSRDVKVVGQTDASDYFGITPGYRIHWRTDDPEKFPLRHPLLLQLHVVCNQTTKIRAAAGWRSELGGSEGGQTVWEEVLTEQNGEKGNMFDMVVDEEPRDHSATVVTEQLQMTETERRMLWAKRIQGRVEMEDVREIEV